MVDCVIGTKMRLGSRTRSRRCAEHWPSLAGDHRREQVERVAQSHQSLTRAPLVDPYLGDRTHTLTAMSSRPPFYILVAHQNASQPSSSNNLRHPATQYHYSDDPALALMPQHPNEQVLVFNYDETASTVQSISEDLIVTGLRVEEAPGAAATSAEEGDARNDRMYIIEALRDDR